MNAQVKNMLVMMSDEEYHQNPAIGHSSLCRLLKSPAHFRWAIDNPREGESPALFLGKALHCAILEPARFLQDYVVFDESQFADCLTTVDEYKAAATQLGVRFDAMGKDLLKIEILSADSYVRFADDVKADMAAQTVEALKGTLSSIDEYKTAATQLGVDIKGLKKDELKVAIKAADTNSQFKFKDEVQAYMDALTQDILVGALSSLDDYKATADLLGIKYGPLDKEELKAAILVADSNSQFKFREDEIQRIYAGKVILKQEHMDAINGICQSLVGHSQAAEILALPGITESSLFFTDNETGIYCKVRPDFLFLDGRKAIILDLKKARDASKEGFSTACATYGYDVQAAYYSDAIKKEFDLDEVEFYFLACEDTGPFGIGLYEASDNMLHQGRLKYRMALNALAVCQPRNWWPSYQPVGKSEKIDLPRWAMVKVEVDE